MITSQRGMSIAFAAVVITMVVMQTQRQGLDSDFTSIQHLGRNDVKAMPAATVVSAPRASPAAVADAGVITSDVDPFAAPAGGAVAVADTAPAPAPAPAPVPLPAPAPAPAPAAPAEVPAAAALPSAFAAAKPLPKVEITDPELKQFKGIEMLAEVGIPIPQLAFDYDPSEEAKTKRMEDKVKEFVDGGMPEAPARLRAQLAERELVGKKSRALHNRKRSIVRLIQEARLKKDAQSRDQRLEMMKIKQDQVKKEMANAETAKREAETEKEAERKARDARVEADRKRVESEKEMMRKIRMEEVEKSQKENSNRKAEEKSEKKKDAEAREVRNAKEKEDKRKMLEEFQAAMQAQMEDQKRIAREERLLEAQQARESRLKMEEALGIKKKPMDVLGGDTAAAAQTA